jgi:hypothetical protein
MSILLQNKVSAKLQRQVFGQTEAHAHNRVTQGNFTPTSSRNRA